VYPALQDLTTSNYRDELFPQLEPLNFDEFLYQPDNDNVFSSDHLFVDGAFDDFTLLPTADTTTSTTTTSGYDLSAALLPAGDHAFSGSFTGKQSAAPTLIPNDHSPPATSTCGAPASASTADLTPPTREFSWAPINTISGSIAPAPTPSLTRQSTAASPSLQTSPDLMTLPAPHGFSTTTSSLPSPASSKSPEADNEPDGRKRKRERNTQAARRYRQRRQDRLEELEEALAAMTKDRDELRLKLARSEAEAEILKGIVAGKK